MIMIRFPCERCGACCKAMGEIIAQARERCENLQKKKMIIPPFLIEIIGFPHKLSADGACGMLDREKNLCTIYDERPLICNIDRLYKKMYSRVYSKANWYSQNMRSCNLLRKRAATAFPASRRELTGLKS